MTPAPGSAPRGRCGGRGCVARAASFSVSLALHEPTVSRGCWRVRWLQHQHFQLGESSVQRRYRYPPRSLLEAAVVADGVDLRAASAAPSFGSHAANRRGGPRVGLLPLQHQSSARSTQREPQMQKEPRIAPGGGRGQQRRRSARGFERLACSRRRSGNGRTRGRSWWRARWSPHDAPRLYGCAASRRCR